ncbi:MAG: PAS domain S-box protein [Alphaproteobacteria bacterium]|nr:PAS domain S-box protein [Alphaproteobacteria bacterium]
MPDSYSRHLLTTLIPLAYRGVPIAALTNGIVSGLVVLALWGHVASTILIYWLLGVGVVSIVRLWSWERFRKAEIDQANVRQWARWLVLGSAASGSMWGLAGFLLFVPDDPHLHTFLLFVIGGMATGAIAVSGQYTPAFQAFFLTSLPAIGVRLFLSGEPVEQMMAIMVVVYCAVIFVASLRIGKSFANVITLEQRIRAIMDNMLDGVVTLDAKGHIKSANPAAASMFGYTEGAMVERLFFSDLIPSEYNVDAPDEPSSSDDAWKWAMATSTRELVARRKDGSTFLADVATSNMTYGGEEIHIATIRDITEQKTIQIQLLQASKLATLGQMAAGIAHELNQPLNVIRMASENALLRQKAGTLDPDFTESKLTTIEQQSEKMGNIINHLRMFSRLDNAQMERFDLAMTINQSTALVREQFDVDGVKIHTALPEGSLMAMGHPNQLEHVLLNLLNNARDAIKERRKQNSGVPETGKVDVKVEVNDAGAPITIYVSDNGTGIPTKTLNQIFDPFFTTKAVGEGTGLGLSIAQGIIDAIGGRLTARNMTERACFEIRLPQPPGCKDA